MFEPMLRALSQLDDPVFVGVLWRSLVWALLAFAGLHVLGAWAVHEAVGQGGWIGWLAGVAGALAATALAVWLFVPVALLIATLYIERVAAAVDRRFYPALPLPHAPAPIVHQVWDGLALGLQVLGLQVVALILAIAIPGIGLFLGWAITGWAIGRGLFVAVAMRRMTRAEALRTYARQRAPVLMQGGILALAGTIPLLNLVVPVLGVAALTHVLNADRAIAGPGAERAIAG